MPLSTARCGEVRVMLNDWLDTLLRGELDMAVPGVTLVQGNGASFTGSGRVQWLAGSDVRVSAVTNGAQSLLARSCILDFSSWKRLAGLSAPATISRPRE